MSTDTDRSQATEQSESSISAEVYQTAHSGVNSLWAWAANKGVPKELMLELINEGTPYGEGGEQTRPPFHTTLAWFDIFSPDGVKIHGTVREGATVGALENMLRVASVVTSRLIESAGWRPADRLPKTDEEIAQTKARMEARFAGERAAAPSEGAAAAPASSPEGTRRIGVESIRKLYTDTGRLCYNVKGHPWNQYGVKAWPDSGKIEKLGAIVDLSVWEVGPTKVSEILFEPGELIAIVALKPDDKPLKVIDWEGANILSDADAKALKEQLASADEQDQDGRDQGERTPIDYDDMPF